MAGAERIVTLGYDMTAVLAMARARGVPELAVVEWLPGIEAMLRKHANDPGAGPEDDFDSDKE